MIIEISATIVTLAFVALVVYLIILINTFCATLNQVDALIKESRQELLQMVGPTKKVLEDASQMSLDLKQKIESLTPIFKAASNVGEVWESKTAVWKSKTLPSAHKEHKISRIESVSSGHDSENSCADMFDLIAAGIRLWQKSKDR